MARRRKQLKPSGVKGDAVEATLTNLDTRSPLVDLPAEVHGIITSYLVQYRDLNHLCCTCKTLSAVVLPTLYHTIELKVPLQWACLPSLEELLASSSEGLKYTRCVRIVPRQYRRRDIYGKEVVAHLEDEIVEGKDRRGGGGLFKSHKSPNFSASNTLNSFIRVLITKFRPHQLHTFWWGHPCFLSTRTLSIVLRLQGTSLRSLSFRDYTGYWRPADLAELKIEGLTVLDIADVHFPIDVPMELLARNYRTLRHVRFGNEANLVHEYAKNGYVDLDESCRVPRTRRLAELMKERLAALKEPSTPVVRLDSLSIIGFDLLPFANGSFKPVIDYNSLSVLKIESCCGLVQALRTLMNSGAGSGKAKNALGLRTLEIRQEDTCNEFVIRLELFLLSLRPLAHLHVLLEGLYDESLFNMQQVLQIHGTSLQSFVWDERTAPRNNMGNDNASFEDPYTNLKLIATYCPGLKALGISIHWENIIELDESHDWFARTLSELSQLRTLNIRNLPESTSPETWLPTDYKMEALATMLLNIISKKASIKQAPVLKTIGIGASTYGNVRLGMNQYTPNAASTFLQLRIYDVNYDCRYRNSVSPNLHLIGRGTPADAWGDADNLDIFDLYWLDGFPRGSD